MYAVRLVNLVIWIGLIFLSIRMFPWKKWGVAIFALLPMTVSQSVSGGVDALLLGSSILLLAYLLHMRVIDRKIKLINVTLIIFICTMMILCKTISVVLLPLILLLRNSQFSSNRVAIGLKTLMLFAPVILYVFWTIISKDLTISTTDLNMSGQDTVGQIEFLLNNPLSFLVTLYNMTFFNYSDTIFQALIGVFGAYDTPLPVLFTTIGYALIAFILFTNDKSEIKARRLSLKIRIGIMSLAIVYLLSIFLAMYLFATPVGSPLISGVQGRYFSFIPYILLVFFVGYGVTLTHKKYINTIRFTALLLLLASVITVISRYYISTPVF